MQFFIRYTLKMVGTSRDSRDTAYLLGFRCPDFFKRSRDSRVRLFDAVLCRLEGVHKTFAIAQTLVKSEREMASCRHLLSTGAACGIVE